MYRCAHPECPGYDWPASERAHPAETCTYEGIRRAVQQRAEALQERIDEWIAAAVSANVSAAELRQRLASANASLQKLQAECAEHRAREWEERLRRAEKELVRLRGILWMRAGA